MRDNALIKMRRTAFLRPSRTSSESLSPLGFPPTSDDYDRNVMGYTVDNNIACRGDSD